MFSPITETTSANHVTEIIKQYNFINTSTNQDGGHMSYLISQNGVSIVVEFFVFGV